MRCALASLLGLLAILCWLSHSTSAQDVRRGSGGVWDQLQKDKQSSGAPVGKKVSAVKRWKAHLQTWGMDTSYNREAGLVGRLNSNGWSGSLFYGWKGDKAGTKTFVQLSFSEIKHEKEAKQKRENTAFLELEPATPYIYGKIANLYTLNLGVGREKLLLPGILEGNVSVGLRWGGGFSLAILKPYYLRLLFVDYGITPNIPSEQVESYAEGNAEVFLNPSRILGAGRWKEGLKEIDYAPGATIEVAVVIESKRNNTFVKSVSLGANASVYNAQLHTLAIEQSDYWTALFFVGISLGKRW